MARHWMKQVNKVLSQILQSVSYFKLLFCKTIKLNSLASGEEPAPKPRKANEMMYGHPMTPNQASPSTSMPHNEDFEMGSPPWPRTPASPVFNSPPVTTQDSFRSTKVTVSTLKLN